MAAVAKLFHVGESNLGSIAYMLTIFRDIMSRSLLVPTATLHQNVSYKKSRMLLVPNTPAAEVPLLPQFLVHHLQGVNQFSYQLVLAVALHQVSTLYNLDLDPLLRLVVQ
jgi:hypothetical protein